MKQYFQKKKLKDEKNDSFTGIALSTEQTTAVKYMRKFAQEHGYKNEFDVFSKNKEEHRNFLCEYAKEAVKQSLDTVDVAFSILRARYPGKIKNYMNTSSDQAAASLIFSITSVVNWFEILQGGTPVVENNALLNGSFGRRTSDCMNTTDLVASLLYLIKHDMNKSLPQAPWVMFCASCKGNAEFEEEKKKVLEERADFEGKFDDYIVEPHRFKVADKKHDGTVKFRMVCTVFNRETGQLWVVSDKEGTKPMLFREWAKDNMNDLLSASNRQIRSMKKFVKETSLLEQLKNPRNKDEDYTPWKQLLENVKKSGGVTEPFQRPYDYYRQAVKIWRYAMMQLQLENISDYEKNWVKMHEVEEILHTNLKIACPDGRQGGDIKTLGATLSFDDFQKLFKENNRQMRVLRFCPHYGCGFLTEAHNIHLLMQKLKKYIEDEPGERERERLMNFFDKAMERIMKDDKHNPVLEGRETLRDYLRKEYADEYDNLLSGKGAINVENRAFVEGLHNLFVGLDKMPRSVVCRALDCEVFKLDGNGFIEMPAADEIHKKLLKLYGDTYTYRFDEKYVNALVIEESARQAYSRYQQWIKDLNIPIKLEFYMDNFETGQATVVPPTPVRKEDFENHIRQDYILKDFTPEEMNMAGLDGKYREYPLAA